jgi:ABC-type transport system involved in multi-copper enzyme maturation permease subunit
LVAITVALMMLLVPGLVGGSIAGERERQTLDLLLSTRVRPWRVVIGKLAASLAFMGFLLVASLPILSVVALLGGIAWGDILIVAGLSALTAVMVGSMSILFSAISKGPTGAIVCSYVATFILLVGPLLLGSYLLAQGYGANVSIGPSIGSNTGIGPGGLIGSSAVYAPPNQVPQLLMALSPGMAIGGEVASISGQSCSTGSGIFTRINGGFGFNGSSYVVTQYPGSNCGGGSGISYDRINSGLLNGWHFWELFTVFAVVLSALCIVLAIVALRGRVPWPRRAPAEPG